MIFGDLVTGIAYLAGAVLCGGLIAYNVNRTRQPAPPVTGRFAEP